MEFRKMPSGFTRQVIEALSQKEFAMILLTYGIERVGERCEFSERLMQQFREATDPNRKRT
jgi:hypothetical protein